MRNLKIITFITIILLLVAGCNVTGNIQSEEIEKDEVPVYVGTWRLVDSVMPSDTTYITYICPDINYNTEAYGDKYCTITFELGKSCLIDQKMYYINGDLAKHWVVEYTMGKNMNKFVPLSYRLLVYYPNGELSYSEPWKSFTISKDPMRDIFRISGNTLTIEREYYYGKDNAIFVYQRIEE